MCRRVGNVTGRESKGRKLAGSRQPSIRHSAGKDGFDSLVVRAALGRLTDCIVRRFGATGNYHHVEVIN